MTSIRSFATAGFLAAMLPAAATTAQARSPAVERVSFYFVAHEDDWQLFMNPSAFADVSDPKTRTVFVHVTAGDAGLGTGSGGRKHPFYLARENGAEAAIRFMADADGPPAERVATRVAINGHLVQRVRYRTTTGYFLRLPDGGTDGAGYPHTGRQSLQRLAEGANDTLAAIDGTARYRGWSDLVASLRALVDRERGAAPLVQINVPELDPAINPGDHPDHRMTAKAALDATAGLACARRVHYVQYASARLPENLDAQQRDLESSVFAVTAAGIRALDHPSAWHRYNKAYVGRNYFRVEESTKPCEPPAAAVATALPAAR